MKKVCVYKQQPNRNIPCPYIKVSPIFIPLYLSYYDDVWDDNIRNDDVEVEWDDDIWDEKLPATFSTHI